MIEVRLLCQGKINLTKTRI